jgi:hypothetical protein
LLLDEILFHRVDEERERGRERERERERKKERDWGRKSE